ncbi:MAG: bifunctional diguanylate cyclase/phosphodiesterase, partial [Rhizobiaceae bacterium]|nr:bifunctional diguanylate cyclase/phosphodiesterase [Rhizobiaceae bacterium]
RELEERVEQRTEELQSANATATALLQRDHLTGAASRRHFESHIARRFEKIVGTGEQVMLVMIDLDGFKAINDTLGHEIGDRVLVTIAERLQALTGTDDLLARTGGNEFALVCSALSPDVGEEAVCARLLEVIRQPFFHRGRDVFLSASIGVATAPRDGTTLADIHRSADIALRIAKKIGRDRSVRYMPAMGAEYERRHQLAADLRQALARHDIEAHFQPKVDCRTGRITGVEALARWRHPSGEQIRPDLFVAIAEEGDLIRDLGLQMLEATCRRTKPWIERGLIQRVAVNLSPRQLDDDRLVDEIRTILASTGFDARHLEFEITENYLMASVDDAARKLQELHDLGSTIALDDFGTGYSNLATLKRLPIDVLKIDKCFVDGIVESPGDQALVQAVIELAKAFSLMTVAEGVETQAQAFVLGALGCDALQGYHFARPMSGQDCEAFLQQRAQS